jgi:death-on-curing protein
VEEVHTLHDIAIELFGGSTGVRDAGMIESAVFAPQQTWDGEFLCKDIFEMTATYWVGLARNHGFVDGNKRVSLMAADALLQFNGLRLTMSEDEAERITIAVARGELDKSALATVVHDNTESLP